MSIFNGRDRETINQIVACNTELFERVNCVERELRELSHIKPYCEIQYETSRIFREKIIERVEAIEKKMVDLEFNHKLVSALVELIKK